LKTKSNFEKKIEKKRKKRKKRRKVRKKTKKKEKVTKKRGKNHCCNPQWNVCGGTVIPLHHLDYVLILGKNITKTEKKKNDVGKNTVAISSNFRRKLKCFPHIL